MKIYYLANAKIPGEWAHSYQIMKMCQAFSASGQEVELLASRQASRIKDDPFSYYKIEPSFAIRKIFCLDLFSYRINPLPILYLLELYTFLLSAKLYLLKKPAGLVYSRSPQAGYFFKDYVLELHDLPGRLKPRFIYGVNRAKTIIVLTSHIKAKLELAGVAPHKILVAGDSIDASEYEISLSRSEARSKLGLPQNKKIALYAGSFFSHDWKGVDVLLAAAKLLPPDVQVVMVGGDESELRKIDEMNIDNVLALIKQPHDLMPYYYRAADALVLPNKSGDSNSEFFTSPLKLFEYMASGTPIVASDLPSIREAMNEKNSFLVQPNDPKSLAEGIIKVLDNPENAAIIAKQSLNDVSGNTWETRAKNIYNFIFKYESK